MIVFLPSRVRVRTIVKEQRYPPMPEHTTMHEIPKSIRNTTPLTYISFHNVFILFLLTSNISFIAVFHAYAGVVFHAICRFSYQSHHIIHATYKS